ncbi:LysR substrate-binding domain-containing protein [Photobacterium alginatilyticum]|uniref:LysR substrate-binding domain-containing protein n=1 Tax=Photobacterium alginatilyticum TaxID=1775171 RepID=UPI00406813B3
MISANAGYQGYREKSLHLVRREIMQSPFIAVAFPAYLALHPAPDVPADLAKHQCLFATTLTGSNDWILTRNGESQIVKVPKSLEVNDSDLLLQNAKMGAGIAYLPTFIVESEILDGRLIPLLDEFETSIWSLNLYYHPVTNSSAMANHFKEHLLT